MKPPKFKPGDLVQLDPNYKGNLYNSFNDHLNKVFIIKKVTQFMNSYLLILAFGSPHKHGVNELSERRFQLYKETNETKKI